MKDTDIIFLAGAATATDTLLETIKNIDAEDCSTEEKYFKLKQLIRFNDFQNKKELFDNNGHEVIHILNSIRYRKANE